MAEVEGRIEEPSVDASESTPSAAGEAKSRPDAALASASGSASGTGLVAVRLLTPRRPFDGKNETNKHVDQEVELKFLTPGSVGMDLRWEAVKKKKTLPPLEATNPPPSPADESSPSAFFVAGFPLLADGGRVW